MKIDKAGLDLIKEFEGFSSKPYLDQALVPTIGYGTTHYGIGGRPVAMSDHEITKSVATILMEDQINVTYGRAVNHAVRVDITQNQFDALVSFAYNLGVGSLHSSTLLKDINKNRLMDADREFSKWTHVNGKVNRGLVARRQKEAKLFLA